MAFGGRAAPQEHYCFQYLNIEKGGQIRGRFLPNYAMSAARWLFGFLGELEKSASVNAPVNV